jgi:hypothetical protein
MYGLGIPFLYISPIEYFFVLITRTGKKDVIVERTFYVAEYLLIFSPELLV